MSRSPLPRFPLFVLAYAVLVAVAFALVVHDIGALAASGGPPHAMNTGAAAVHMWLLGVLGMPFSVLGLAVIAIGSRSGGLAGGYSLAATWLLFLVVSPLVNLGVLTVMLIRRARRLGRKAPPGRG